jgi:carboxyl-terminal processing protease
VKTYRSKGGLLPTDVQLVVLTNKGTFCGSELLAAALREGRRAKLVGETTFGKWNAQVIEPLENKFAIKYTISEFRSPSGQSFQGKGLKPDVEIPMAKDLDPKFLSAKYLLPQRLDVDAQLRAAIELVKGS